VCKFAEKGPVVRRKWLVFVPGQWPPMIFLVVVIGGFFCLAEAILS
jgi:hypothetical protein